MEIHFYPYGGCETAFADWYSTDAAVTDGYDFVETTQMGYLSPDLWKDGYRIFIHGFDDDVLELKAGDVDEFSGEVLVSGSDLFDMWRQGSFDI